MKNKLSFSAVEKYLQCGRQYYLYYIRGLREKTTGSALIFGSAVDKGLNVLLDAMPKTEDQKNTTLTRAKETFLKEMTKFKHNGKEIDLETTDLVTYGNEDFDIDILTTEDHDCIHSEVSIDYEITTLPDYHKELIDLKRAKKLNGDALKNFNYMSWVSLRRKGLLFLEAYKDQVLPNIKRVIAIQQKFSVANEDGDEFNGYIDLIAEYNERPGIDEPGHGRIVIFDNKTSAGPYKDDSVWNSKQLASYFGVIDQLNLDIDVNNCYLGYIVIVKKIRKKKEPLVNIQVLIEKPNEALVEETFRNYDEVNQAIHNGEFPAKPETCKGFFGKCFCSLKKEELVDISDSWSRK